MIDTKHLAKVAAYWVSIVYVVCFLGVAIFPGIREGFMRNALHTDIDMGQNVLSFGTFIYGLIIWNIIAFLASWLFAALYNSGKK